MLRSASNQGQMAKSGLPYSYISTVFLATILGVVMGQRMSTGRYSGPDYVTVD